MLYSQQHHVYKSVNSHPGYGPLSAAMRYENMAGAIAGCRDDLDLIPASISMEIIRLHIGDVNPRAFTNGNIQALKKSH